ncbi:hypothetical protein EVG20_g3879 [Dentipellis fragilis]|uniref:Transcription elongation factor Eaf N-terminal domain-containing protein n=1 Tax=Dentipellis fragilis TaxID=205917 RepID=A0A4Y9Z0Q3_9AGAM|nr:hypothetical protein EVG20_g3879 [Dentipellis fragilis]
MAPSEPSWMPAPTRHKVAVGSSLGKALKARKGAPAPKRSNLPERDFYSFRYNFRPESIDATRPGTIEVTKGKESTTVHVERPTFDNNYSHSFDGEEKPGKEWECVLIYDEEMGTFTLEKLDSSINFTYRQRVTTKARPSASASPMQTPSSSQMPTPTQRTAADELEAQILEGLEDAEGEPDDGYLPSVPALPMKVEEEEGEIEAPIAAKVPVAKAPRPKAIPASKPKAVEKPKPIEKPQTVKKLKPDEKPAAAILPPRPRPTPKAKPKTSTAKRPPPHADVEEIEFSRPPPPKRARPTPPPPPAPPKPQSFSLALPTSAGPDPLAHQTTYAPETTALQPDSDDEDWDEVAAPAISVATISMQVDPPQLSIHEDDDGDEPEDIGIDEEDITAFEADLERELELSAEEEAASSPGMIEEPPTRGGPISLNQFAGGVAEDYDDFTSSDESDD